MQVNGRAVARSRSLKRATHEQQPLDLPLRSQRTVHRGTLRPISGPAGIGRSVLAEILRRTGGRERDRSQRHPRRVLGAARARDRDRARRCQRPRQRSVRRGRRGSVRATAGSEARRPRFIAHHDADPRLSRARPSGSQPRSARSEAARQACRPRSPHPRLHRGRHGPRDPYRQHPRLRERDAAPDRACAAPDLLRQYRRRIHAHPGPGPAQVAAGPDRRQPQPARIHRPRQDRDPGAADRRRDVREVPRQEIHRHQALRPRRRRIHDPGAGAGDQARQPARREGSGHRHGPSRAAQHARQLHEQAVRGDLLRVPGQCREPGGRAGLGRRQIPSRHLGRPRVRRAHRPSVADRQPLAPGSRQHGGAGQGARQAAPAQRQERAKR